MFCNKHPVVQTGLWLWLLASLTINVCVQADDFSIAQANTHLNGHMYNLDADIQYQLSKENENALQNGVDLTLILAVRVYKKRWYLWDEKIVEIKQRYLISYQSLTEQYQLKYLNTGIDQYFSSLGRLLKTLGALEDLPLLDEKLINQRKEYKVQINTKLDIEALPAPLRPLAYISSEWRLSSGDYTCLLTK